MQMNVWEDIFPVGDDTKYLIEYETEDLLSYPKQLWKQHKRKQITENLMEKDSARKAFREGQKIIVKSSNQCRSAIDSKNTSTRVHFVRGDALAHEFHELSEKDGFATIVTFDALSPEATISVQNLSRKMNTDFVHRGYRIKQITDDNGTVRIGIYKK